MERQPHRRLPPFPRLGGRLHIFPAFIPMVELLPWLLTAVGALAGASQIAFWRKHRRRISAIALACFVAAGGIYGWGYLHRPTVEEGTRLIAAADLPAVRGYAPLQPSGADPLYDSFSRLWSVRTKDEPLSGPVFVGDRILFGTYEGRIEARARKGGALLWAMTKHEPVFTNPVTADGKTAFIGEGLHTAPAAAMTAFDIATGKSLWGRQFRSHLESAVTLDAAHNRLWTCAGSQGIWSLDTRNGDVLWHNPVGHIDATPLLLDGRLYASAQPDEARVGAEVFALDADSGKAIWKLALPGNTMGSPQEGPANTLLLTTAIGQVGPQVATDRGWSHAVDKAGKLLWTVALPGLPLPEAAVLKDKGLVIHTLKTGEIVALHTQDGSVAWHVTLGKEFDAPATLRADTVPPLLAAMTVEGTVSLMNAEDGTEIRRLNMGQGGYVPPAFNGDILYLTTPHGIAAYGGVHLLTRGPK